MPCIVKKTLETIVETKNHYVVAVKKNRKKLYKEIDCAIDNQSLRTGFYSTIEKNKGRIEYRSSETFKTSEAIQKNYPHAKSIIKSTRETLIKERETKVVIYYLSDLALTPEEFHKGIRGHWSIEIKLHYVKDVVMNEDRGHLKDKNLATIFSLIRSYVISIAKIFDNSVTNFQRTYAHNPNFLSIL